MWKYAITFFNNIDKIQNMTMQIIFLMMPRSFQKVAEDS